MKAAKIVAFAPRPAPTDAFKVKKLSILGVNTSANKVETPTTGPGVATKSLVAASVIDDLKLQFAQVALDG